MRDGFPGLTSGSGIHSDTGVAEQRMALRTGMIGLGVIGGGIVRWTCRAGIETWAFDLDADAARRAEESGAQLASSCAELAARCDVIGVAVRDDAQVLEVLQGERGALAGAKAGSVVAIHSTVRPKTVEELARQAAARDVHVIDAPVTGGSTGLDKGTLVTMVGGEAEVIERCRPVFEAPARAVIHTGPVGSALRTKLCNNLVGYLGFAAAYEANLLATASGLDLARVDEVLCTGGNLSGPALGFLEAMQRRDLDREDDTYQRYVAGITDLALKDLDLALELASELGISLPATEACKQWMPRVYGLRGAEESSEARPPR